MFEPLHRVFTPLDRPVLFEDGIGALLDQPKNNRHVFPILRADEGSYSFNQGAPERTQTSSVSGNQLSLVTGYQTTYNQRIVISGSTQMCSNEAMMANRDPKKGSTIKSSPNYILCTEMAEWNLGERGVIRVDNVRHNKVGDKWDGHNPENYKRQVDIEYFIDIYEKKAGQWVPFNADDVQF